MKGKLVYITGAAGFIGRNLARYYSEKGWKVYGIGLDTWGKEKFTNWGITKWSKSKISYNALVKLGGTPDLIVHCAGSGSVANSLIDPESDFAANVLSLVPVLEFIKTNNPKTRLVYLSSIAAVCPISPYGNNKRIAEELCETYSTTFGLSISVIRFFSIYGAGLRKQLIWDACEKISKSEGIAEFYGTGKETRDWLNIEDALSLINIVSKTRTDFQIINGGSGNDVSIAKIVNLIEKEFGKKVKIVFNGKVRAGDPKHYLANVSKARNLGWRPKVSLEKGIRDYISFYKKSI